jgi:hypothetical protein
LRFFLKRKPTKNMPNMFGGKNSNLFAQKDLLKKGDVQ